jgi:C-terminal processing protease CtpA/Prc
MRRYWAGRRLVDVIGDDAGSQPLVLSLRPNSGGAPADVQIPRNIELDLPPAPGTVDPSTTDTGAKLFSAKVLGGGWGYFRLDGFSGTADDRLISETMDRIAGTPGLILDLRQNGGGDLSGDRVIERLIDKTVIRYKRSERLNDFILSQRPSDNFNLTPDATGIFSIWHDLTVAPLANHRYSKPVVALISPYCFSACDTFAAALKGNGLATFVGEPTGGGTGTPLVFDLPVSPLQFRYSVIRGQTPSGALIEGNGTFPDVPIEPSVNDRVKHEDSQLAKAIEVLQHLVQGSSQPVSPQFRDVAPTWTQREDRAPTAEEQDVVRGWTESRD